MSYPVYMNGFQDTHGKHFLGMQELIISNFHFNPIFRNQETLN